MTSEGESSVIKEILHSNVLVCWILTNQKIWRETSFFLRILDWMFVFGQESCCCWKLHVIRIFIFLTMFCCSDRKIMGYAWGIEVLNILKFLIPPTPQMREMEYRISSHKICGQNFYDRMSTAAKQWLDIFALWIPLSWKNTDSCCWDSMVITVNESTAL